MDKPAIRGYIVIAIFAALVFYIPFNLDFFVNTIASGSALGIFLYFATDIRNWVIILSSDLIRRKFTGTDGWRGYTSGFFFALSADIISLPRLPPIQLIDVSVMKASFDYIFINNFVTWGMSYGAAYNIFCYIVPLILFAIALEFWGISNFIKKAGVTPS